MTRLTLRGLASRKLRTALTAVAIVLGVAMISGTYVLTDTIDRAFTDIFQQASKGVDVAVTPKQAVDNPNGAQPSAFDASLLDRVKTTQGIAAARGDIFRQVVMLDKKGEPLTGAGPPTFAASVHPDRFEAFTADQGRLPTANGEVALDKATAEIEQFKLGDTVTVAGDPGTRRYKLVGIAKFGSVNSLAGAKVVLMTLPEAQVMTDTVGRYDSIAAAAAEGLSDKQARDAVRASLRGESVAVRTGQENADKQSADTRDQFGFLRIALLVFAGIALFVGSFVIYNTFSITVAQRTRELALLRTLGASRRQVLRSVVLEASIIGLVAAIVGLAGGLLVAPGIVGLFKAIGVELPTSDTVLLPRTVVVSLLIGVGVTVIASVSPALRATRVPPMAAMREGVGLPHKSGRARLIIATVLGLVGLVGVLAGLFGGAQGGSAAGLLGAGAGAVFFAVALFSPQLVRPLAHLVGAPFVRFGGMPSRLARENATRQPGRTAATAAALMVGLALVTFVTIFAAGFRASVDDVVDRAFAGDLTVQSKDGFSPVPATTLTSIDRLPDVDMATSLRFSNAKIRGIQGETATIGVDPAHLTSGYKVKWSKGDDGVLKGMGDGDVIVDKGFGTKNKLGVGDTLHLTTTTGARVSKRIVGITDEGATGLLSGGILVSKGALERQWREKHDAFIFLTFRDGVSVADGRKQVDSLLKSSFPSTESQDRDQVKETAAGQINQLLGLFYALLALSVIVSLFGIVNTLALSIHERTRELGMLRAIGTSRKQVKRTVRLEAAITAMIGAVLGLALGTFFAWLITQPLLDEGFAFSLPVVTLGILFVVAALAGVVAAIGPARRAARIDVLRALAYE